MRGGAGRERAADRRARGPDPQLADREHGADDAPQRGYQLDPVIAVASRQRSGWAGHRGQQLTLSGAAS